MDIFHQQLARTRARVRREGRVETVSASELQPGELVLLSEGEVIPADCRLVFSKQLRVQEGPLTGESGSVGKNCAPLRAEDLPLGDRHNMVFFGTYVATGSGLGVVTAVGDQTEYGRIVALAHSTPYCSQAKHPPAKATTPIHIIIVWILVGILAFLGLLLAAMLVSALPAGSVLLSG